MTVRVIIYKEFLDLESKNRGKLILPYINYHNSTLGIIKDSCFTPIEFSAEAFGRLTVFLTRQAAEKALGGSDGSSKDE